MTWFYIVAEKLPNGIWHPHVLTRSWLTADDFSRGKGYSIFAWETEI